MYSSFALLNHLCLNFSTPLRCLSARCLLFCIVWNFISHSKGRINNGIFYNTVTRKPKIDMATGGWSKGFLISSLLDEQMNMDEFLGTYYRLIWMGEIKKAHKFLGVGSEENWPSREFYRTWKNNTNVGLRKTFRQEWIKLVWFKTGACRKFLWIGKEY